MKVRRAIALLSALLFLPAVSFAQKVTLDLKGATVGEALEAIQSQTGYSLYYTQPPVDESRIIDLTLNGASVKEALEALFAGTGIVIQVSGNKVYLSEGPKDTSRQYKGHIYDDDGQPVVGAAVLIQGTLDGCISDLDGNFTIKAPEGTTLEISSIGYRPTKVRTSSKTELNILLQIEATQLEEVVMVGYSSRSREKLISSVSTLGGDKLTRSDVPNLQNALSGKMSGVFSRQTSGEPGNDNANIQIRGFGRALVVVDGVPGRDYSDLDPNEIESVSVLKDASAAAVYGMQGANGVILVTTKRGGRNKPTRVEVTSKTGIQVPTRYPKAASSALYQELLNEYRINQKIITNHSYVADAGDVSITSTKYDTDWYKLMIQPAPQHHTNLNITGGSDSVNYFISGGYLYQGGIWSTNSTSKNRFNLRSNLDADLAPGLTASVSMGLVASDCEYPASSSESIGSTYAKASPLIPVKWHPDDKYYAFAAENTYNPIAMADTDVSGYRHRNVRTLNVDAALEYKIPWVDGLSVKANLGYTFENTYNRTWNKTHIYMGYRSGSDEYYLSNSATKSDFADLTVSNSNWGDLIFQGYLTYKKSWENGHSVNAGLVYEVDSASKNYFYTKRINYPTTASDLLGAGLSGANINDGETLRNYFSTSVVERFSYDYKSTYFIDINTRLDGAQYFAKKWGFFPSVSLGWMVSNEPWMEKARDVLKELKLRASYGVLGDLSDAKAYYDETDLYYYQSGYRYPGTEMTFGDRTLISLETTLNPNPAFTWSTSSVANIGADFKLFEGGLLSGSFEVFYRSRNGLPAKKANDKSGDLATYYNLNSDSTRGLELMLDHQNRIGEVSYGATLNFSWSRSKYGYVEHLPYPSGYDDWEHNLSGRWTNIRWGYRYIGRFSSFEEAANYPVYMNSNNNAVILPGDLKYEDANHDGYIDENDRQPIGRTAYPEILYGLNLTASWRGFDFVAFLQGAACSQFTIPVYDRYAFLNNNTDVNCWAYLADRWHKADYTSADSEWIPGFFPATRDIQDTQVNTAESSFWMFDGSYLRVKNIELGYTFKFRGEQSFKSDLRVFFCAYNPFTFSSQPYFDPEVAENNYSFASYPQLKTFTLGLNLKF